MSAAVRHDGARYVRPLSGRAAAGAVVVAVLGYGLGVGLARATQYAEDLDEDECCRARPGPPSR